MKVTLPTSKAVKTALDNFRAKELDKIFRLKLKLQASEPFKTLDVTSHLDMQAQVIEQADHAQLAQMYLQQHLLNEYNEYSDDPTFILGTHVEASITITKKNTQEPGQTMYYLTTKKLHEDLIMTVDEHYKDFTESQYKTYEEYLPVIEMLMRDIECFRTEGLTTDYTFESTKHKYEVTFTCLY